MSRPDLYPTALTLAKEAISFACFSGDADGLGSSVSADTCLALALFSLWAPPPLAPQSTSGISKDKRWVWAGLAVRMAEELAANLPPAPPPVAALPPPSLSVPPRAMLISTPDAEHSSDELFGMTTVLEICRTVDSTWSILRSASFAVIAPMSASIQSASTSQLSQALEGLRSTTAWSVLTRRHPVAEGGCDGVQLAKSLQNQLPHVMGTFLGGLMRPNTLAMSTSGNVCAAKSIQKCLSTLDELGEQARGLVARGDISGVCSFHPVYFSKRCSHAEDDLTDMNVLCQNIVLDILYYRLVVRCFELQTNPEENAYPNNGGIKRRGRPSKTSKGREPLVAAVSALFAVYDSCFNPTDCGRDDSACQMPAVY